MPQKERDHSLGDGVYYAPQAYVGIGRRLVIMVVDGFVLAFLFVLLTLGWMTIFWEYSPILLVLIAVVFWLYLVPLKRSKYRTVGYWLLGCKLVNLQGKSPSLLMLTFRTALGLAGPFSLLWDIIWCGMDEDKQTLRDRYSSICVVKQAAEPIGTGEIHLTYLNAAGYSFFYPRVSRPKAVK